MPVSDSTYVLDVFGEDGRAICELPIAPDWEPALEYARFAAIRRGTGPAVMAAATGTIEPVWHVEAGAPYVAAIDAVAAGPDPTRNRVSLDYLADLKRAAGAALAKRNVVPEGSRLHFHVRAEPMLAGPADAIAPESDDLVLEEIVRPLPLTETALAPVLAVAEACGEAFGGGTEDMPVLLPRRVLAEVVAQAGAAGEVEVGGFLLGRLHRDRSVPEVFVEITAQVAAEHTLSEPTKLTFTPDTWAAARAAVEARGGEELLVGWHHFHPDFCRRCPPERREHCALASTFFSAEDRHLHRVCFVQAHAIALLVSATPDGLVPSLYGWRRGQVTRRGYHLTGVPDRAPVRHNQGEDHDQKST